MTRSAPTASSGHALLRATLSVAILGIFTAGEAFAQSSDGPDCRPSLLIRDRLDLSGQAEKPATVTLQHTAGSKTFGVADIAVMGDVPCLASGSLEQRFGYGVGYHLNTSGDAPSEQVGAGLTYQVSWKRGGVEPSQGNGTYDGTMYAFSVSAEYGRDIEKDMDTGRLGLWFNAFPLGKRNDVEDPLIRKTGWFAGRIQRKNSEGPLQIDEVLFYELSPGIEYFSGYQPAGFPDALHAAYGAITANATWSPFAGKATHEIYLRSDLVFRSKLSGDDALPDDASTLSLALGYRLNSDPDRNSIKRKASIELAFEKGRSPEQGFVKDETFFLRFTYLLDRAQ